MEIEQIAQNIFDRNIGSNQELGYRKIEREDVMNCILEALMVVLPQANVIKSVCIHEWVLESVNGLENSKCKKCGRIY